MKALEDELSAGYETKRADLQAVIDEKRLLFAGEVARLQFRMKTGLFRYIIDMHPLSVLFAPVIYSGIFPLILLDLFVLVYQAICFPVYGIPKVRRREYMVFDRTDLPYLNALEKFNCFYCEYANGLTAYFREVAARTEQYWCPIKHARRIIAAHERYPRFFEYGDAESYRKGLERLRMEYGKDDASPAK
jgi:hypothetical protein